MQLVNYIKEKVKKVETAPSKPLQSNSKEKKKLFLSLTIQNKDI